MPAALRGLSTVVPPTILVQSEVRDVYGAQPGLSRLAQRILSTAFNESGIVTRHSVLEELTWDPRAEDPVFFDNTTGDLLVPGTRVRNDIYVVEASRLYVEAGRAAIEATPGIEASDVTHVITVSCTGFYAPGPDFVLARDLGLQPGVERYHLGFMGCYASIPALRLAAQLCEADSSAVVLVVSVELCTLHLRSSSDPDEIVASSLFADGGAAGIVTARPLEPGERAYDLDRFATRITPEGEGDMAWKIGDTGFDIGLSPQVPSIIGTHITGALEPLFAHDPALATALEADASADAIEHWAVHPGGRSILDRVEARLALREDQLVSSRSTLRDFGNMSSVTVLFVLRHILDAGTGADGSGTAAVDGDRVTAMAFGPGLTVESALLTVRG